jgi:excisionase family DNA binding protein
MPDNILTVAEVAKYLKVSRSTIDRLLKAHKIPAFKIGSNWRFNLEHIDEWRMAREKDRKR